MNAFEIVLERVDEDGERVEGTERITLEMALDPYWIRPTYFRDQDGQRREILRLFGTAIIEYLPSLLAGAFESGIDFYVDDGPTEDEEYGSEVESLMMHSHHAERDSALTEEIWRIRDEEKTGSRVR